MDMALSGILGAFFARFLRQKPHHDALLATLVRGMTMDLCGASPPGTADPVKRAVRSGSHHERPPRDWKDRGTDCSSVEHAVARRMLAGNEDGD